MAAGLGFKTFTTGEVLTAADTNGYLMQGVNVFANAAARTAAITSPQEGQMSYLKDTDSVESYSGSAWVAVGGGATSLGYAAGKNKIINGDFGVWQRGTSFTPSNVGWNYTADRFACYNYTGTTMTATRQTFTPGTAPVAGYEGSYFLRVTSSNTSSTFQQIIEDVRTFAGQTITISMWLKSASGQTLTTNFYQDFGSGGSSGVVIYNGNFATVTSSWARYSVTVNVPSISGKTIGTSNGIAFQIIGAINNALDVWGVQIEAGSTATAFQTATGSIQGELAACQRYYFRTQTGTNAGYFGVTVAGSSTTTYANVIMKQTMRTTPTSVDFSGLKWQSINNSANITAASISDATPENVLLVCTTTGATAGAMNYLSGQSNTAYVGYSAEL